MRVLIAYDGSECSDAAIDDLVRAGLPVQAEALVVSVADLIPLPPTPADPAPAAGAPKTFRQVAIEEAQAWAERGRARLARTEPSWEVTSEVCADSPWWAIVQRAESWRPDLVVVGSHGRSALARAVLGSVAQKVLYEAPCTVRVARGRKAQERPGAQRLVVGADGSPGADAAVDAVLARKWPAGSAARVVTVMNLSSLSAFEKFGDEHDNAWTRISTINAVAVQKLAASGIDSVPILVQGDPARDLVAEAEGWGADCIFVGERGLFSDERKHLGSVASSVAARAPCSVEVVRAPRPSR